MKSPIKEDDTREDHSYLDRTNPNAATCPVCRGEVLDNCEAVSCDKCEHWYHKACGKISDKQYNKILAAPLNKSVSWFCTTCKKNRPTKQTKPRDEEIGLEQKTNTVELESSLSCPPSGSDGTDKQIQAKDVTILNDKLTKTQEENQALQKTIKDLLEDLENLTHELTKSKKENIRLNQETISKGIKIKDLYERIKTLHTLKSNKDAPEPTHNHVRPLKSISIENRPNIQQNTHNIVDPNHSQTRPIQGPEKPQPDNVSEPEILIIGDSLIRNLQQYTESKPNIMTNCMPGARIQNLSKHLATLQNLPPTVILHIGTNNLMSSRTPNDIMRPLWYTIEAAQKKFKDTIWIVNGIIHRRDIPALYIESVNEAIQFMCDNLHVVYRDPNKEVTARGLGRDGLHLNQLGDHQLANFILNDIGHEISLYKEEKTNDCPQQEDKNHANHTCSRPTPTADLDPNINIDHTHQEIGPDGKNSIEPIPKQNK